MTLTDIETKPLRGSHRIQGSRVPSFSERRLFQNLSPPQNWFSIKIIVRKKFRTTLASCKEEELNNVIRSTLLLHQLAKYWGVESAEFRVLISKLSSDTVSERLIIGDSNLLLIVAKQKESSLWTLGLGRQVLADKASEFAFNRALRYGAGSENPISVLLSAVSARNSLLGFFYKKSEKCWRLNYLLHYANTSTIDAIFSDFFSRNENPLVFFGKNKSLYFSLKDVSAKASKEMFTKGLLWQDANGLSFLRLVSDIAAIAYILHEASTDDVDKLIALKDNKKENLFSYMMGKIATLSKKPGYNKDLQSQRFVLSILVSKTSDEGREEALQEISNKEKRVEMKDLIVQIKIQNFRSISTEFYARNNSGNTYIPRVSMRNGLIITELFFMPPYIEELSLAHRFVSEVLGSKAAQQASEGQKNAIKYHAYSLMLRQKRDNHSKEIIKKVLKAASYSKQVGAEDSTPFARACKDMLEKEEYAELNDWLNNETKALDRKIATGGTGAGEEHEDAADLTFLTTLRHRSLASKQGSYPNKEVKEVKEVIVVHLNQDPTRTSLASKQRR